MEPIDYQCKGVTPLLVEHLPDRLCDLPLRQGSASLTFSAQRLYVIRVVAGWESRRTRDIIVMWRRRG